MERVDEAAEELYALAPADFIPARAEAVARAKAEGDKEAAAAIAKLAKPTVAAWLVNLLVREQHEQLEQFVDLGASLRDAASALDGEELKALNRQRRQIVIALVRQAVSLGRAAGQRASSSVEDEIRETLEACLADPSVGAVVLQGRLAKSVQYAGFGGAAPSSGVPGPAPVRRAPAPVAVPDLAAIRLERAQKALDEAERGLRRAERERDAEAGRLRAAEARRDELEAKVLRVRSELAELEGQLETATATFMQRQSDLATADQALARATTERSRAADDLAHLTP